MYELRYLPGAERYFKKIRDKGLQTAFRTTLAKIAENPYIGQMKSGDLAGVYSVDVYYNKNNYEIAYRIYEEDRKVVVVLLAGTRENFYKELKRYMK